MNEAIELATRLNETLSRLTPEERLKLLEIACDGFCNLCGTEHLPCYCAPEFDE